MLYASSYVTNSYQSTDVVVMFIKLSTYLLNQAVSVTSGDYYADYQSFSYSLSGGGGGYTSAATVLSSIAANVAGIRTSGVSEPSRELPALTVDSVKKRLNDQ